MMIRWLVLLAILSTVPLVAQTVDEVIDGVDRAVEEENYRRAIALIEEGKREHPDEARLWIRAGDLYRDRRLYRLSLAEYLGAERLDPTDREITYRLSRATGILNDNEGSTRYLERLYRDPDWRDSIVDDLGWMYFKTHRLEKGATMLEDALDREFHRDWAVTLGTIYSGLYDYERSKRWYRESIDDALADGDDYFASVALYNLSLLEFSFYRYDESLQAAEESLELRNRSGGHLVKGELLFQAWDLPGALSTYREAEARDETPLSRIDIATLYLRAGRLEEAIRFVQAIRDNEDESWMYYYGIDEIRWGMDVDELLSDAWRGRARVEALTPRWGVRAAVISAFRRISWRVRSLYHERRFRSLTRIYARAQGDYGSALESAWHYSRSAEGYRRQALRYLAEARSIEVALTERAVPWYDLEVGREKRDPRLLMRALEGFLPEEGEPRERALRELALIDASRNPRVLRDLFDANPGGFRQYGLTLPLTLTVVHPDPRHQRRWKRRASSILRNAGHRIVDDADGNDAARITLNLTPDGPWSWFVTGPGGEPRGNGSGTGDRKPAIAESLAEALDGLYRTPLPAVPRDL